MLSSTDIIFRDLYSPSGPKAACSKCSCLEIAVTRKNESTTCGMGSNTRLHTHKESEDGKDSPHSELFLHSSWTMFIPLCGTAHLTRTTSGFLVGKHVRALPGEVHQPEQHVSFLIVISW